MIKLVEGAERQKTPNEIALNILLVGLTIIFVFATATIPSYVAYAGGTISVVILVALFVTLDSDHHRRAAVGDRHRRHGPPRALQRAGDVRPRGRGGRRRRYAPARQDRHHHARQPAGDRVQAAARRNASRNWPMPRSSPRWPTRPRRGVRLSCSPRKSTASAAAICRDARQFHPVHRADPHERRRSRRILGAQGRGRRDPELPQHTCVAA